MKKIEKYEQIYINLVWIFLVISVLIVFFNNFVIIGGNIVFSVSSTHKFVFIFIVGVFNFLKQIVVKKGLFCSNKHYVTIRVIEIVFINLLMAFFGLGKWIYLLQGFIILLTSFKNGRKGTVYLVGLSIMTNFVFQALHDFVLKYEDGHSLFNSYELSQTFFMYFITIMFSILCGKIYEDNIESEQNNKKLYIELEEKFEQLSSAQEEIKQHNEKLKETNYKIEDANKKLRESIAEFYTVQQITQAISSIFDVKELLRHVNDIIIGVMGVNNSTIILYDEKKDRLKVNTTNVSNKNELITLFDNINSDALKDVLKNGEPLMENSADPKIYSFIQEREVCSFICVPLVTKSKKFGLVLVEHKYINAFDEDNLRLLSIIGQQVSIALENAELYEKMHELATIDNLTGVYNRLYFQQRLQEEFETAEANKYDLSLAIFDIDHFKRFNDTFGHLFGDKVLKHICDLLKSSLRSGDIIARFGGEEFVLLFPRTGLKEAYDKVERLREKIAKSTIRDELVEASVTVSFGLSTYPYVSETQSDLLKMADDALYVAKNSGRNCVKVAGSLVVEKK